MLSKVRYGTRLKHITVRVSKKKLNKMTKTYEKQLTLHKCCWHVEARTKWFHGVKRIFTTRFTKKDSKTSFVQTGRWQLEFCYKVDPFSSTGHLETYCAFHVLVQPNFRRYYFYFLPDQTQTHLDHFNVLDKLWCQISFKSDYG